MITLSKPVIVEGKYDKIKLSKFIDSPIIETRGFGIFKDKEKIAMLKVLNEKSGLIIATDSDNAGEMIRKYIIKCIGNSNKIICVYLPQILGKEKRKTIPSKEGFLGLEGTSEEEILKAFKKYGALTENLNRSNFKKSDFFILGLSGSDGSKAKKEKLLEKLELPSYVSTNTLLDIINSLYEKEEFLKILQNLD